MKYVLFALGLLLLLIGAYSIYFGAGIIEVERGWSSVIAGTTAFVGGILIIGVAWIIKTLEQIGALLHAGAANVSVASGIPAYEALQGNRGAHAPAMDLPMPGAPVSWPPQTFPVHTAAASSEANAEPEPAAAEADPAEAVAEEMQQSVFVAEVNKTIRTPAAASRADFMPEQVIERAKPSVKDLWKRIARETEAKPSADVRPVGTQEPVAPETPALMQPPPLPSAAAFAASTLQRENEPIVENGDWLDHAFAEIDASLTQTPSSDVSPANVAEPPASEPAQYGPHVSEPASEAPHADFAAEPPPPLAHEPASPEFAFAEKPAVIGRYEAEGTNYVMYADGSIEAHSERGVAHFKSMADLKAYFETQGTPQ